MAAGDSGASQGCLQRGGWASTAGEHCSPPRPRARASHRWRRRPHPGQQPQARCIAEGSTTEVAESAAGALAGERQTSHEARDQAGHSAREGQAERRHVPQRGIGESADPAEPRAELAENRADPRGLTRREYKEAGGRRGWESGEEEEEDGQALPRRPFKMGTPPPTPPSASTSSSR